MTMFQCPTRMGKGVLVSPTTHGNTLLGPTADDIDDGYDVATTRRGLDEALEKVRLTWPRPSIPVSTITTFSGVRAHEENGDFIIGKVEGAPEGAYRGGRYRKPRPVRGSGHRPGAGRRRLPRYLGLAQKEDWKKPTPAAPRLPQP